MFFPAVMTTHGEMCSNYIVLQEKLTIGTHPHDAAVGDDGGAAFETGSKDAGTGFRQESGFDEDVVRS